MPSDLLPYRQLSYQTDLSPDQIGQRLVANIVVGLSLYSEKPYYGTYTPYSFSARKTTSRFKQASMGPTVEGSYRRMDGKTIVQLNLRPSTPTTILFFVLAIPLTLYLFAGITDFLRTGDLPVLVSGFVPLLILYGVLWLIFQTQSRADIQFWEYTLALRENHA